MSPKLRIPNFAKHIVDRVKWVQFVFITTKQIRLLEFPFWNRSSIFANHIVVVVAVLELNRPNESVGKMNIASILMANIKWWRMLRQHLEMDKITCPVKKQTRQILKNERNEIQIKNEITKIKCNVPTLLVISEWLKSTHKWQWLPPFTRCVQNVKIIQFQARAHARCISYDLETHAASHIICSNLSIFDCLELISIRFAHSECLTQTATTTTTTTHQHRFRIWAELPPLQLSAERCCRCWNRGPQAEKRGRKANTSGKMRYNSGTQKFFQVFFLITSVCLHHLRRVKETQRKQQQNTPTKIWAHPMKYSFHCNMFLCLF